MLFDFQANWRSPMSLKHKIAIRRQDKSVWEGRTPLTPSDVKDILRENPDIQITVQPSTTRIYSNFEYENAGAEINEDLSACETIFGIKQISVEKLLPNKTYLFFSHLEKTLHGNVPLYQTLIKKNIRLIDYELITNEKKERLIAFGKYAGIAGALDFLKGFGDYLMLMGYRTPFLHCNATYKYKNIEHAYEEIKWVGEQLKLKQIPQELSPMIFGITGRGRVAKGCLEVLEKFPITNIKPEEVELIWADRHNPIHRKTIYVVSINTEDCMELINPERAERGPSLFDRNDYYQNPSKYKCNFSLKYLPYLTALFHCIYYDVGFPLYIEKKDIKQLKQENRLRLIGVCDASADADGAIEFMTQCTTPEQPFFYYDVINDTKSFDPSYKDGKIVYLGVDFLPCELAHDASNHFSSILKQWIPALARSDMRKPINEQELPAELERAVFLCGGELAPRYKYNIDILNFILANKDDYKKKLQKEQLYSEKKPDTVTSQTQTTTAC